MCIETVCVELLYRNVLSRRMASRPASKRAITASEASKHRRMAFVSVIVVGSRTEEEPSLGLGGCGLWLRSLC